MALMIFSIWLMVDVPGNRAFPSSISPRIQPRLHMSTPLVYLWMRRTPVTASKQALCSSNHDATLKMWLLSADAPNIRYLVDPSRISGALYHRVATYSVSAGFPLSSWIWLSDLARPKSHSLTTQSVSSSTLDGCVGNTGKRNNLHKDNNSLIFTYQSKGHL